MRGLKDLAAILYNEADFFSIEQEENILHLVTRYQIKNNSIQIMTSTANRPGSLFNRIEHDPTLAIYKLYWPYTVVLGKIYSEEEVKAAAKKYPCFSREMDLSYGSMLGKTFSQELIDDAVAKGKRMQQKKRLMAF